MMEYTHVLEIFEKFLLMKFQILIFCWQVFLVNHFQMLVIEKGYTMTTEEELYLKNVNVLFVKR